MCYVVCQTVVFVVRIAISQSLSHTYRQTHGDKVYYWCRQISRWYEDAENAEQENAGLENAVMKWYKPRAPTDTCWIVIAHARYHV